VRVWIWPEPPLEALASQDRRHAVVYLADQFIGGNRDDRERPDPFVLDRILPVLPKPGERRILTRPPAETRAAFSIKGGWFIDLLSVAERSSSASR
jgi:hypothetical protein